MQMESSKNIYIIGHKNPDTDSICSAISYAYLKNELAERNGQAPCYVAARAGRTNDESEYVLKRFGHKRPVLLTDMRPQVSDIAIRKMEGLPPDTSLKKAWDYMRSVNITSLPILQDDKLAGVITVGDIAYSDMNVYDNMIISKASTSYRNIVETLDGEMVVGDINGTFNEGHVLVAAANPDLLEGYLEPKDMVIVGNRYEAQLCAIEMEAACIIVCTGAAVSKTIRKMANVNNCRVITTPYDTFTVARLICHSMPVEFYMTKENLITFHPTDFVEDIKAIMTKTRLRYFPIVDSQDNYIGVISRRNLLELQPKKMILVDHNEKAQAVDGFDQAEILEIIDHHRLGNIETAMPLYFRSQPLGCTSTIVATMYMENDVEIPADMAGLMCSAIISDTLLFHSPTCTPIDIIICEKLAAIAGINLQEHAEAMFNEGSKLSNKSAKELFYQDFKQFHTDRLNFGVGQVSSINPDELESSKEKLLAYMKEAVRDHDIDMLFFMLTSVIEEKSQLLILGEEADELISEIFDVEVKEHCAELKGVVSRKKQLVPLIIARLNAV